MPFSNNDSAARIREQANKLLLERAQQREQEQERRANKALQDLADERIAHRHSKELADAQLDELCVTLDTLIEFILLNHGEIPSKLAEIIAARQEQRIERALPQGSFVDEGVKEGNTLVVGAAMTDGQFGQLLKAQNGTLAWAPPKGADEVLKELTELLTVAKVDP